MFSIHYDFCKSRDWQVNKRREEGEGSLEGRRKRAEELEERAPGCLHLLR